MWNGPKGQCPYLLFIPKGDQFNPFTPKFKNYILPTFLKSKLWVSYEKPNSSYCSM